jgi:hypothetical protein
MVKKYPLIFKLLIKLKLRHRHLVSPIKNGRYTSIYNDYDKDDLVLSNALKLKDNHPVFEANDYNYCHWVEEVLDLSGFNWMNPNPFPYN